MNCFSNRADPLRDPAQVVFDVPTVGERIQFRQRRHLWNGLEAIASESANLALYAALLVRAGDPWLSVEGVNTVVRAKRNPPVYLHALPAEADNLRHRCLEIVVADLTPRQHARRFIIHPPTGYCRDSSIFNQTIRPTAVEVHRRPLSGLANRISRTRVQRGEAVARPRHPTRQAGLHISWRCRPGRDHAVAEGHCVSISVVTPRPPRPLL